MAELNEYDWGIKYGQEYAGATVPLLEDFLRYAAYYNLGVTWHSATYLVQSDEFLAKQFDMIDKYGLTDNCIVIAASGNDFGTMKKIGKRNPRISFYVGGEPEKFANDSFIASINELQTGRNRIYVQLYPWGTAPSDEFIKLAKANDWVLYDSITMTESKFLDVDMFNKGYGLRELNNVYMVKDTMRAWADKELLSFRQ